MKNTLFATFGSLFLGFVALFIVGIPTIQANNSEVLAFANKLDDGKTIEMFYNKSTKKLGIIVKDKAGNNISGYIVKNVSKPIGEFDLNLANKYGEVDSLGSSLKINNLEEKYMTIRINDNQDVRLTRNQETTLEKPPFGDCYGPCYLYYDWYLCWLCCVTSSDC